ncbi:MAG: DUF2156 domain-containing protein [Christensenellales bacterium]|jgi:hypothetical protein
MLDIKPVGIEDRDTIERFLRVWNFDNADLSFSNIFMWRDSSHPHYFIEDDVLYLVYLRPVKTPIAAVPIPLDRDADFHPMMMRIVDYMKQQNWAVHIVSINEELRGRIEICCPGRFAFSENRDLEEYVYSSEELRLLPGRRYHSKRNHINKFLANYSYVYQPLRSEHTQECLELYDRWQERRGASSTSYLDERKALVLALDNREALGMEGCVILINGEVQAFSLGTLINPNMADIHFEKANDDYNGIYTFINQQFVEHQWKDVPYINREEDMGIAGLRRAKMSYYPIRMVTKFEARLSEQ